MDLESYSFYSFSDKKALSFQTKYYSCIEYIHKANEPFRFDTKENCLKVLIYEINFIKQRRNLGFTKRFCLPFIN